MRVPLSLSKKRFSGDMWKALELALVPLAPGGRLLVAIYNYQRAISRIWWHVKRTYNRLPRFLRPPYAVAAVLPIEAASLLVKGPRKYISDWRSYYERRGMSRWHDIIDWVGGFPFEVASPGAIFEFNHQRGLSLERLSTSAMGCNEFVFSRRNQ